MKTSERARIPRTVPAILAVLILIAATAAGNAAAQTGPPTAPSTPMNPAASLVLPESGNARVRVGWDNPQNPGITGYTIARSDGRSFDSPGQATTYTDESALPGSPYTYTVTARSAGGDSPASAAAGIDVPDPPPGTRNVSAAVRTPEAAHESVHVTLTWDPAPEPQAQACEDSHPVTQYRVSRSTGDDAPVEIAVVPEGASLSHTDGTADFNTAYTYDVEAVSRIGRGAASTTAVDTPKRPVPPPTELDVDEVNTPDPFGGTVVIEWTAPQEGPAITGYRITRQDPGAEPHVLVENTESADTAHTDSGLSAGLTYVYTVAALSTDNASPESGPLSVWAPLPAMDPAARADTDHIDVSWTAPEETTRYLGYIVRRREAGQADWAILSVVESLEYADRPDPLNPFASPPANNTAYHYSVQSRNELGIGSAWAETGPVIILVRPPAPTGLTASAGNGRVTLDWTAPDDDSVTGYQVLRRRPPLGENRLMVYVENTGNANTTYTDTNITAGVRHVYRVKAINVAGVSGWSNYARAEP